MSDPLVGHALEGRYEITQRIARGGMATVYIANDLRLTRTVAVKVMHVGLGDDADFTRKFDREARSAARLSHPNVVSVFDQGVDQGRPFIVMEYVHGRTLRSMMRHEGPMDTVRALTIAEAVLCALAAAHEAGLIHRDIKPENVLISDRNQIKVADFGLAKAISAQSSTATAGLLIGTVSYLPPELVTSGKADARSDVYSAGIVLYELLTGRKPHIGDSPIQVAYAHVHNDVPPPSDEVAGIPNFVDALVQTATARDPQLRPRDARIMLQQLRTVRAKLRSGVDTDDQLTEVISTAAPLGPLESRPATSPLSPGLDQWSEGSGIPVRSKVLPAGYNPRTQISPSSPSHHFASPASASRASPAPAAPPARPSTRRNGASLGARSGATPVEPSIAPRQDHRRARRRGLIALMVVLSLTAVAALAGWWAVAGRTVDTPAMINMTEAEARTVAEAQDLTVSVADNQFSETVPDGRVISSHPESGSPLRIGGDVQLTVSKGPERFRVPKLVGQSLEDARAALEGAHLKVGQVSEKWHDSAGKGAVTKMSGEPGARVRRDTPVDLTVSKGPKPIKITSYQGKKSTDAQTSLEDAGFKVKVEKEHSETVAEGLVISQSPDSGEGVKADTITITESLGMPFVAVPNVRAKGVDSAVELMEEAGFKVQKKPVAGRNALGLGVVSYTDPETGAKARKGSTITLYYV